MGLLDDAIREHLDLKRKHGAAEDEIVRAEQEALAPARRDPSAGAGVPPLEEVPGEPLGDAAPLADEPPPTMEPAADAPPPPSELAGPEQLVPADPFDDDPQDVAPPVDDPVYADSYSEELPPADSDDPLAEDPLADEPIAPPPIAYRGEDDDELLPPEPMGPGPAAHPPLESIEPLEPEDVEPIDEPGGPAGPDEPPDLHRAQTSILDDPLGEEPPPPAAGSPPADDQDVLEETPEFLQETPEHDKLWFEQKPPRDFDFE
jgi:hypothetical protein